MTVFTDIDDTIAIDGFTLRVYLTPDHDMGAPWDEHDGHDDVSEWTTRHKRPGEWVLCRDGGSMRYYDFAGAAEKAKAEGWDAAPYGTGTKGQQAERAVKADFEHLRAWCNGEWRWIGVVVTVLKNDIRLGSASLFGIESDDDTYILEVANQLIDEATADARATLAALVE